ncbi:MAG: hypothetical protein JWQ57_1890 [Mucilaginibacter sp.]|nr:hypothetical protein [Mucilaginibacter sp.]
MTISNYNIYMIWANGLLTTGKGILCSQSRTSNDKIKAVAITNGVSLRYSIE